jgi:hypothetical protein
LGDEIGDMADSVTTSSTVRERRQPGAADSRIEPICHRGFWRSPGEKNTEAAFRRSLELGLGIETDIRDRNGEAVIAHDVGDGGVMTLAAFFQLYNEYPARPVLALNIKADGLQGLVKTEIERYGIERYFVFDMSIPDLLGYRAQRIRYYARVSEYEISPIGIDNADGVWLDQFENDWVGDAAVRRFNEMNKDVCIVSPELHRRDPRDAWSAYRKLADGPGQGRIYLCTDFPSRAQEFFA